MVGNDQEERKLEKIKERVNRLQRLRPKKMGSEIYRLTRKANTEDETQPKDFREVCQKS